MNGLDQILKKIENESKTTAEKSIEDALKKSVENIKNAIENANKEAFLIKENAIKECELIRENIKSSGEAYIRISLLKEKTAIINELINSTIDDIKNQNTKEYFELLKALIIKHAHKDKEGIIFFSEKDAKNIPRNFIKEINKDLKDNNASLKLSDSYIKDNGGFILSYGKIEENCTLKALIEEKYDKIKDKLSKVIL